MANLVLIIAAHNEESVLASNIETIFGSASRYGIMGIIVAENGSSDRTLDVCKDLKSKYENSATGTRFDFVSLPKGDLGLALSAGLKFALSSFDKSTVFLITAADLPFGFTDIEAFSNLRVEEPTLVIGSKGHPRSTTSRSVTRSMLSLFFRILRIALLSLPYRDTQGTVFIPHRIAEEVLPRIRQHGFFFTTELVFRVRQLGYRVVEIPVTLQKDQRKSTVHWFRSSRAMLASTLRLAFLQRKSLDRPD